MTTSSVQWTDDLKARVISIYKEAEPTPENSSEIIKDIAETIDASPNGVRMILVTAGVYVKKEAGASKAPDGKASSATGVKRVSKETSIAALREAIEKKNGNIDEDIFTKLTGKAAVYFLSIIEA